MDEIRVKSNINRVSVFPDRAMLTRRCFVELEEGPREIVFEDMPATILPGSLRVKGSVVGNDEESPGIRLLGMEHRPVEPAGDGAPAPKGRRRKLEEDDRRIRNRLENLRLRRSFFLGVLARSRDHFSRQLTAKAISVEDCDAISDFLFRSLAETDEEIRKGEGKEREIGERIAHLEESGSIPSPARTHQVRLRVQVTAKVKGVLELSYMIPGARWTPFYEIWAAPEAQTIKLQAYGIVSQEAGEPWPDVKMSLSTVPPPLGVSGPELEPYYLRPAEERKEPPPLGPEGAVSNFEIQRLATVPPDGSPVRVLVGQWEIDAEYEFLCIPKISESAFLRATLKNTLRHDLLPGTANIFYDSDFIGTGDIPFASPSEEFEIYLGVDSTVRVRQNTERQAMGKGGVISKVQRKGIRSRLTVQNLKGKEKKVVLIERLPVSQHKEIRVKDAKFSPEPRKKSHTGIYIWSFPLKNKEKQEIQYSYTVEYPRAMALQI